MIVITYRTSYNILANNSYQRLDIRDIGFCYLLSNSSDLYSKQEDILSNLFDQYYKTKTIFLIPESLKELFVKLFRKIEDKNYSWRQYDVSDLGGIENTVFLKKKIIKCAEIDNPDSNKMNFIEILTNTILTITTAKKIQENINTMDYNKLQKLIENICKKDNGVSGIAIINRVRGKIIIHSKEPGADGHLDFPEILSWLTPITSLKKNLETEEDNIPFKYFEDGILHFKEGAVILDFIDDQNLEFPVLIIYVNLNVEKVGLAEVTAHITTQKLIPLLQYHE